MNSSSKRAADNLSFIDQIMRRVQGCDWNTFKLNEIVTLERCLQECSASDPKFNIILRKLANESVFVEPARRVAHLNRSKQEEHDDSEHKRMSLELRKRITDYDEHIRSYEAKLEELIREEQAMKLEVSRLEEPIARLESICRLLSDEFGLLLERVYDSFNDSLSIIKEDLPEYVNAIGMSKLIQQVESLPTLYRRCVLKLVKNHRQVGGDISMHNLAYHFKKLANSHLNDYLVALINLYRDLALIEKLYSGEIANELDQIRNLERHVNQLGCPIIGTFRKVTIKRSYPDDEPAMLSDPMTSQEQSKFRVTDQDPELAKMFGSIARLCKAQH